MSTASEKAQILAQIAAIKSMEFGKLSEYQHRGRPKDSSSYYRLQIWCDGKNRTRYIRPEELPAIQEAIDGHARFRELRLYRIGEGLLVLAAVLTIWSAILYVRAAWPIMRDADSGKI